MAYIANAYRRGAVYWWRRQIALFASERPMFALSLRTPDPTQARRRAATLTVASEHIRRHVVEMSQFILSTRMRRRIFQDALREQLDRIIADQVNPPGLAEDHKRLSMNYAALYRHWAKAGPEAEIAGSSATTLLNEGWSGSEIQELKDMAALNRPWNLLSRSRTEELLDGLKMAVTNTTVRQACQIIFDARSRACVLATELAGQVMPFGDEWAAEAVPGGGSSPHVISPPSVAAQGDPPSPVQQRVTETAPKTGPKASGKAAPEQLIFPRFGGHQ